MALPRELAFIIDGIINQDHHLLQWEVFGNAADDIRIMLTWRKIKQSEDSSVDMVKPEDVLVALHETDENWKSIKRSFKVENIKRIEDENTNVSSIKAKEHKERKKNPFRKLRKNEKLKRKGKLQLSLSIDEVDREKTVDKPNNERRQYHVLLNFSNDKSMRNFQSDHSNNNDDGDSSDSNNSYNKNDRNNDNNSNDNNNNDDNNSNDNNNGSRTYNKNDRNNDNNNISDNNNVNNNNNNDKDDNSDSNNDNNNNDNSVDDKQENNVAKNDKNFNNISHCLKQQTKCNTKNHIVSLSQIKSKETAKKVLEVQRNKFKMSIDQNVLSALQIPDTSCDNENTSIKPCDINGVFNGQKLLPADKFKSSSNNSSVRTLSENSGETGVENCVECNYNGFCDDQTHKEEYMSTLLADAEKSDMNEDCVCNVCTDGGVHNGCVYREISRLKHHYKLFDKRNLCFCKVCFPFKYRQMCLRQELRVLRKKGKNLYYRLTCDSDDDDTGYHPGLRYGDSLIDNYDSESDGEKNQAKSVNDIELKITKEDKISFRNCLDCQFTGFCEDIRHKKLYTRLLRHDDVNFDELEEPCACLVCVFKGAAHSGCVRREMKRLRYDLKLFDERNLCECEICVPFKYRTICLRQELKKLRRKRNINLYPKLY
ncbi:putative histone-lysine N-methyltransferase 1 [Hydractinia symbiolongicarpus]|uniref:putative histone-lysine N-methyltransferase 1 n=1 Tax=Hydractinia symbiolongicarpus TaxID=13093 RepID=UPI00254F4924|nr:putative histone-lysine N-methyltransferase 1 [Hydractinia symbiolongicarpus]